MLVKHYGIDSDVENAIISNQFRLFFNDQYAALDGPEATKERAFISKIGGIAVSDVGAHIGSDEVGTGSYFGPIVVVASAVDIQDIPFLMKLKVGDSKKISDNVIKDLAPKLIKRLKHKVLIIDNKHYNDVIAKNNHINVIKAIAHNKALLTVYHATPHKLIIMDQFVNEQKYYQYLAQCKDVLDNIIFITKAESKFLAVAASSIIARYYFLKALEEDGQKLQVILPSGAGSNVDEIAQQLIDKLGVEKVKDYVKWDFKNSTRLKY